MYIYTYTRSYDSLICDFCSYVVVVNCHAYVGELQCVAVCCSVSVLQCECVAVSCSVLLCAAECCSELQCVALCYGALQCVAVCLACDDACISARERAVHF